MCGIVGIINESTPNDFLLDIQRAKRMVRFQEHRGPDHSDIWYCKNVHVILGHNRLSIIDLSNRSAQPMMSFDKKSVIVFNGEIFNYKELARQYLDQVNTSYNDTRVLIELYSIYGAEWLVKKLNGMFSFIITDLETGENFIARDRYGIKPLYYEYRDKKFTIASELRTIKKTGYMDYSIDKVARASYFATGFIIEPRTIFEQIRAFSPGILYKIDRGLSELICFGDILAEKLRSYDCLPERDCASSMHDSITAHTQSDAKAGVFLSAGYDSSAVLSSAIEADPSLEAITLNFTAYQNTENDEVQTAKLICNNLGVRHYVKTYNRRELLSIYDSFEKSMDQPAYDGLNVWLISKYAKELNWKVALCGTGADELLYGYSSFTNIWKLKLLSYLVPISKLLCISNLTKKVLCKIDARLELLWHFSHSWNDLYLIKRLLITPDELRSNIDDESFQIFLEEYRKNTDQLNALKKYKDVISCLEFNIYLRNQLLRVADWASMKHSIELRVPYVDANLHRNLFPIVHTMKMKDAKKITLLLVGEINKRVLKNRNKTGFNTPIGAWISQSDNTSLGSQNLQILRRTYQKYLENTK